MPPDNIRAHIHPLLTCSNILSQDAIKFIEFSPFMILINPQEDLQLFHKKLTRALYCSMNIEKASIAFEVTYDSIENNFENDSVSDTEETDQFLQTLDLRPCLISQYGSTVLHLRQVRENDILFFSLDGPKTIHSMIKIQHPSISDANEQILSDSNRNSLIQQWISKSILSYKIKATTHASQYRLLHDDLLQTIFSFLTHTDILQTGLVCKKWKLMTLDNQNVWQELCAGVYYQIEKLKRSGKNLPFESYQPMSIPSGDNYENDIEMAGTLEEVLQDNSKDVASINETDSDITSRDGDNMDIPLDKIKEVILSRKYPPLYKYWKTYYRYYIHFAATLTWDTNECGPAVRFDNQRIFLHNPINAWQTTRASHKIFIPTLSEQIKNGIYNPSCMDDIAFYEWEIQINKFDRSFQNGWWIVVGIEYPDFPWKEAKHHTLIGYNTHSGFGYSSNGDRLHLYSNPEGNSLYGLNCEPLVTWPGKIFTEKDIIRVRLRFCTKHRDSLVNSNSWQGGVLEFFVNGVFCGQAFRNIKGDVYPAVSLLRDQSVTLRNVDPIREEYFTNTPYK